MFKIAIECESSYVLDIFQIHLSCFLMVLSLSLNLSLVGHPFISLITGYKFSYVSHESSGYSLVVFFINMSDSVSGWVTRSPADLSWTAKKMLLVPNHISFTFIGVVPHVK